MGNTEHILDTQGRGLGTKHVSPGGNGLAEAQRMLVICEHGAVDRQSARLESDAVECADDTLSAWPYDL